jgi:hypothetical protein
MLELKKRVYSKRLPLLQSIQVEYDCNYYEAQQLINQLLFVVDDYMNGKSDLCPSDLLAHANLDVSLESELMQYYEQCEILV